MKKIIFTIMAITLVICGCNKTKQFKVNLNLQNADNKTVYLYKGTDPKHVLLDSAVFVGNSAELKADFDDPQTCYIIKFNKSDYKSCGDDVPFFTENQNTTITGDYQDKPHWSITGCPTMNALNAHHQESLKQFEDPMMAIIAEIMKSGETGDTLRVNELYNQLQPLIDGYMNNEIEFIRSHSGDYLGHFLLEQAKEELEPEKVKELADGFTTESVYSRKVKEYLNAISE
ncbi:MAG: DUF4369 domain-containing protein [Bacteroidales bacterium]|nr:DUF4369 domain-containing protein [Bacteroidales bacterium]